MSASGHERTWRLPKAYIPGRAYDVSVRLLLPLGYVDTERRIFIANLSGVFVSCRIVCF
jgi:hypothetical protein